jgi:hypothetical protein
MKCSPRHLAFITISLMVLLFSYTAQAEEKTLIELTFDPSQAGSPPPTAPFNPGAVNHSLESTVVTDANKLEVVKDVPGFSGPALRFTKESEEPRTPKAVFVNSPGLLKTGKVRFTWDAQIDSFAPSAKFPGTEALLTFVVMDAGGKPFSVFYYLVDSTSAGGTFSNGGPKTGSWKIGAKQQFELLLDLDASTANAKVDGTALGTEQKFTATDGLRVVQFADGAGLAFYGSKFTATLANFKMTTF